MNALLIWSAVALSLAWFAVHLFMGGREVAAPLVKDEAIAEVVRYTAYLCWHITSATLLLMAAFFATAQLFALPGLLYAATALAAATALVGIAIPPRFGLSYKLLPQGWLFVPIALLGLIAAL
ncbi:MAG: hypothetical protein AAFY59_13150 [Pseudomonadota bacterium]